MLFVALAAQGQDGEAVGFRKLQERAGDGRERRLLVVATVESVQHPVEARQADRPPDARVYRVLFDGPLETCQPHPSRYAQPVVRPVLVSDEEGFHVSVGLDALTQVEPGVIRRPQAEEVVVALEESVKPYLQAVAARRRGGDQVRPAVVGASVVALDERLVFGAAQELSAGEVVKRGD